MSLTVADKTVLVTGANRGLGSALVGAAVVELLRTDAGSVAPAYLLTGSGLQNLA